MHELRHAAPLTLLVAVLAVPAFPAEPYDDFQAGDFGRVRFEENGVLIVRSPGGSSPALSEAATLNAPIFPGDEIRTEYDQRVEVQLAGGSLVRIDGDSDLVFQALPDPYAESTDNVILKLGYGTARIASEISGTEEFRIDTPDASIYLLGNGDFRIEVDDRGQTRVLSRRGVAEVVGDGGSVLLRGGMRTTAYSGSVPDDPESFNTFVADDFDRWVEARDETYRPQEQEVASDDAEAYREIPAEVRPYYHELGYYGRWVYVPAYGYCWYPYDAPAGWRPYYHGHWSYGPRGYFWVSNEPWGWAPYHYGRWNWMAGYGWCWFPGRVFGGAWVSWSWGSAYLGWAPLNPWNQPVWIRTVHYGYYDPGCWTFVSYRDFGHGHGHGGYRHYSVDDVGDDLHNTAVVTRPPRLSPRDLAADPAPRERIESELLRDPGRRVPVIRPERPSSQTFDANEGDLVRRGRSTRAVDRAADDRAAQPSERVPRSEATLRGATREQLRTLPSSRRPTTPRRVPSESTGRERPAPAADRGIPPQGPTRSTQRTSAADPESAPAIPRRAMAPSGGSRAATPREQPSATTPTRGSGPSQTDTRLRSLYRQVSEPRKTEQSGSRTTSATTPSAGRRGPASDSRREAAPRSSSPSRAPSSEKKGPKSSGDSKSQSSSSSSKGSDRGGKSGRR